MASGVGSSACLTAYEEARPVVPRKLLRAVVARLLARKPRPGRLEGDGGRDSRSGARKNEVVRMLVLAVALAALVSGGCSDGDEVSVTEPPKPTASLLVQAPPELRVKCQATADEVGYPVPCPTRVPDGLTATRAIGRCELDIIGSGVAKGCGNAWRGWVVGSSETNDQHLVIVASPRPLRSEAKVVNGPAWYPGARVRPLRSLSINGWRMRAVYVPVKTNAGSAFMRHVVLIWTVRGHTYGIGFHNVDSLAATLDLDAALARGVRLIVPAESP
jgi:hypothetical protein